MACPTVWVLGDQLNTGIASLEGRAPGDCRVLLVESAAKLGSKRWHIQRLHLVVSAMAHFAAELEAVGFDVDYRRAPGLAAGLRAHCEDHEVTEVIAMEPMSWDGRAMLDRLEVTVVRNNQFLCHYDDFAEWAEARKSLRMEDFYRWQRSRLGVLMDGDQPRGGRWNFDDENREPPPRDGREWPALTRFSHDDLDEDVLRRLPEGWGAQPDGTWPVTREQALVRLSEFFETGLASFGPHEDAMLAAEWKLAHSCLSSSLNLGLLHPGEVLAAAEAAYATGTAPINSVEGFVRQVLGWREYVWGVYWLWMPDYRQYNVLQAARAVPPALTGGAETQMACVRSVVGHIHEHGYAHHIERLMVLGNLALTAAVDPQAMTEWMWASFVDGAEWVMVPNVVGMALFADGGMMATKPYASGGAYLNRMSDSCRSCRYDPKKRAGPDACPFTTLYWDFLDRNRDSFRTNHRLSRQLAGLDRLVDLEETRQRAKEVLELLESGEL
ncbi:MAG: cryptochrome/photolyase family protein [Acidimicrobiales bacterium]|nr:cryptochrome/photolyase family protein [Acidimicrobiales bacterium]